MRNDLGSSVFARQLSTSRIALSAILPIGAYPEPEPAEGGRETISEGTSSVSIGYAWRSISASCTWAGVAAILVAVAGATGAAGPLEPPPKLKDIGCPLIVDLLSIAAADTSFLR
jgi:hypothetical protein